MPCSHQLEAYLDAYITRAGLAVTPRAIYLRRAEAKAARSAGILSHNRTSIG